MPEYHVGCGAFGIYAGTFNQSKTIWIHKSKVTDEAVKAVAQYLLMEDTSVIFSDGTKRYRLKVEEVEKE